MSSEAVEDAPSNNFRVGAELCPKSKQETYKRIHYYVAKLGITVSDCLQDALIRQRKAAADLTDPKALQTALKGFSDDEFLPAVKEIMVVWLHLEALDQGGEQMDRWVRTFLRLAFGATDYLLPGPAAMQVIEAYDGCDEVFALYQEASYRIAFQLGFREPASYFASVVIPVFIDTGPLRQKALQMALSLPEHALYTQSLFE